MTPRINNPADLDREFASAMIQQSRTKIHPHLLTDETPVMGLIHPKILKAKLEYLSNPEQEPANLTQTEWKISCYPSLNEAKQVMGANTPTAKQPFEVRELLQKKVKGFILDAEGMGSAVLAKEELNLKTSPGLHQHLLSLWTNYALSPELWGNQGKWPRFHERLNNLFQKHHLLAGKSLMGYYQLSDKAKSLENFGFVGTNHQGYYALTLPWTFPLSALHDLEKIISQEF